MQQSVHKTIETVAGGCVLRAALFHKMHVWPTDTSKFQSRYLSLFFVHIHRNAQNKMV